MGQIDSFQKLDPASKRKTYLVLLFLFFLSSAAAVFIQTTLHPNQSPASNTTTNEVKKDYATLSLSSDKQSLKVGEHATVTVQLDSYNNPVDAADFFFSYDPKVLTLDSMADGTFFSTWPIKKAENGSIRISGIATLSNNKLIVTSGKGKVTTLQFTALSPMKSTQIRIDGSQTIIATNGKNILDKNTITPLSIEITQ